MNLKKTTIGIYCSTNGSELKLLGCIRQLLGHRCCYWCLHVAGLNYHCLHGVVNLVVMHDIATKQKTCRLTLEAKAIELAGDVSDEALGKSAKAEFGNEVTDHAVEGFIISFNCLWPQHVFPQETPYCLPFLPLTSQTDKNE